jgi:hypothetical protein
MVSLEMRKNTNPKQTNEKDDVSESCVDDELDSGLNNEVSETLFDICLKDKPKKIIRRKVTCVFGKFDEKSDFVLEPSCPDINKCEECENAFWIEGEEQ